MHDPRDDFRAWCDPDIETAEEGFGPTDYVLVGFLAICVVAIFLVEYYGSAMP